MYSISAVSSKRFQPIARRMNGSDFGMFEEEGVEARESAAMDDSITDTVAAEVVVEEVGETEGDLDR